MRPERLSAAQITAALECLPRWRLTQESLQRNLRFGSFAAAFAFMQGVALVAEELDHHPEWSNVYDRVEIRLRTHSAGGITALDLELASRIDALAGSA